MQEIFKVLSMFFPYIWILRRKGGENYEDRSKICVKDNLNILNLKVRSKVISA